MAGEVVTTASAAPVLRDDYSTAEPGERRARSHPHARSKPMHSRPGTVSSIDAHPDGKHATIRVTHGKRKKDASGEMVGYHRQDSHVTIPKADAKGYAIGQRVHAGIAAADAPDQDGDEAGEVDETANAAPPLKTPTTAPSPKSAGKKKAPAKTKKKAKGPSRIASALNTRGY